MKATVVPIVIKTLGAITPKLGGWPQQIPGTTSETSVQKSGVENSTELSGSQASGRGLQTYL